MTRKSETKRLRCPLFGIPITFVCGFDAARKIGLEPEAHWGAMASTYNSQVYLTLGYPDTNCPNTIAHEAVHCAWRILDLAGVEVEAGNHEVLAYMTGWIVEQATAYFNKNYTEE